VEDWNVYHPQQPSRKILEDIQFNIRKGEVVGIAGLMGAGRTELAMSIFGKAYGTKISGKITKQGKQVKFDNISQAIKNGVAYVTEDRKHYGLILKDDIKQNIALASLGPLSKYFVVDRNREVIEAESYRKKMNIKTPSINQLTGNLSGGNQQKVVLSKWILTNPDILMLDEPTRGIDVGAKYEIYTIINQLAEEGKGVLVISSELPELIGMCDRIYVMNEGRMTGQVHRSEANQETLMKYMTKGRD
jgi:putative multiple sugar transport system ATP-binding protein